MDPAGRRRDRIEFVSAQTTENTMGEPEDGDDISAGFAMAQVNYGTGSERREAGHEGASVAATFRVLATAVTKAITPKHAILFDGGRWDVTSNVPWERRERDITAVRKA